MPAMLADPTASSPISPTARTAPGALVSLDDEREVVDVPPPREGNDRVRYLPRAKPCRDESRAIEIGREKRLEGRRCRQIR